MSQCLRCNKPCVTSTIFCDECQLLLRNQIQVENHKRKDVSEITTTHHAVPFEGNPTSVMGDPLERLTIQYPERDVSSIPPPSAASNMVEQAFHKLSDAARRIAAAEPERGRRKPRASRLSPLRDISADIRRHSTSLPRFRRDEGRGYSENQRANLPDLWPWLQDADDVDEKEESWSNSSDPLNSTSFP